LANLANQAEVKKAQLKDKERRRQELNDIRTVLSNASGRRLIWRLMDKCKTFNSVYSAADNMIFYNSGQQDLGHFIMSEIVQADENLLIKMMKDNKTKE
jgi:hypothetical protein